MQTLWKLSQDGNSASRTLDNGSFESRLVIAIPEDELATALPADLPTLFEVQSAQLNLMDAAYQSANTQPIAYLNTSFQADDASTALLAQTITIATATNTQSVTWWDINNVAVPMTLAQLITLGATIFARGQGYFAHKQAQKAAICAAQDVATVQAVAW